MKTTIELSDLVMLQMMGYLDKYVSELISSSGQHDEVVESARQRASTPQVFEEIVKKSVRAQFGEAHTIFRELAQNGKDSYDSNVTQKRVEFSTGRQEGEFTVSARDFGNGMTPIGLIRDLLIPYNSGKDKDIEKIGEHGIGWYSIMDFADVVDVISGREGITTRARIQTVGGKWQATIETTEGEFTGTEVIAHTSPGRGDIPAIRMELKKQVGYCDSETVKIMLNGEQVNTLGKNFSLGGQMAVAYKGKTDTLDLYFRRTQSYHRKISLTQDGLFIKEEDIPFTEDSLHYSFMNAMIENGFNFWIDLPTNVGLTKGRNNVVARDRNQIYGAMLPAFEQCVLDVVLEDDQIVKKMDSKISEWVRNIFDNRYGKEAKKSEPTSPKEMVTRSVRGNERQSLEERIASGEAEKPDAIIVVNGTDHFKDLKRSESTSEKEKKVEEAAKAYYQGMSDFSKSLFEKQFLPAQKYVNGQITYVKISIDDMIKAYASGLIFDSRWQTGEKKDGLYVDGSFHVVSTVLYRLNELRDERTRVLAATRKRSQASDASPVGSASIDQVVSSTPTRRPSREEINTTIIEITNRTNLQKIMEVVAEEGVGQEYLAFLEVANYVDDLISKANNMYGSPVMMHYNERMVVNVEIAHTDRKGISFNFADRTAYSLVKQVREGSLDFDTMLKLVDILVHEKAHCKRKEYDPSPEHGRRFYEEDKKELRENFIAYCFREKIDPLRTANELLGHHQYGIVTDPKAFGDLIEKYSSPEYVTIKTK